MGFVGKRMSNNFSGQVQKIWIFLKGGYPYPNLPPRKVLGGGGEFNIPHGYSMRQYLDLHQLIILLY